MLWVLAYERWVMHRALSGIASILKMHTRHTFCPPHVFPFLRGSGFWITDEEFTLWSTKETQS